MKDKVEVGQYRSFELGLGIYKIINYDNVRKYYTIRWMHSETEQFYSELSLLDDRLLTPLEVELL